MALSWSPEHSKILTFSFRAALAKPLQEAEVRGVVKRALAGSMRRERRPRPSILVIDDDPRATSFLSQYLLPEGHDVTCAYSGLHALMTVENKTPDVILLDLIMPDMDGFEVLTMLRRDEQLKHVPVVLLTPRSLSAEERSRILSDAQALVATQGAAPHDELAVMRTQLQSMGLLLPRPSASR